MQKNKNLVDTMLQEYSATFKVQNIKQMIPKIQVNSISDKKGESYTAAYEAGLVQFHADNHKAAVYGLSQIVVGVMSGHLPEFLGHQKPHFPMRPIWLPAYQHSDSPRRILEMGYNAVVIGKHPSENKSSNEKLFSKIKEFQDHEIKVILALEVSITQASSCCPLDQVFIEKIKSEISSIFEKEHHPEFLFWQSNILSKKFHEHPLSAEATTLDLLREELFLIEKLISNKAELIFYLPASNLKTAVQHVRFLENLCNFAGKKTTIAFSSVAGDPWDDNGASHPFWDYLRTQIDPIKTPILPIVNAGGVNNGEGLWPTAPFDKIERFLSRLVRHHFAGAIVMGGCLPAKGSFNDCNLWSAGKALWSQNCSSNLIIETWIKAYHSNNCDEITKVLRFSRNIVLQLQNLNVIQSIDEVRRKAEHLMAEVNLLSEKLNYHNKRKGPSIGDYMRYFIRDLKKLILLELQEKNITALSLTSNEDLMESFWTMASRQPGDQHKIKRLVAPIYNQSDPVMSAIFLENRLQ